MNSCNISIVNIRYPSIEVNHVEAGVPKPQLGFDDKSIRAGFIRKVFLSLILMLFVVAAMTSMPFIYQPLIPLIRQNVNLYVSIALLVIIYFSMACMSHLRRSYPQNIGCASLLAIAMCFITTTISAFTEAQVVLLALAITLVSWPAIIFTAWFAIDIQLIIGSGRYEITPEDYIFATTQLFLDIMIIFWLVLIIVALVAVSDDKGCDCDWSGSGCGSCSCSCCDNSCDISPKKNKRRENRDQGPVLVNAAPIIAQPL
ncbi:protein lifeguard 1 [Ditylenchus destructor]|uniref:Protein lifeguard 1 n=1 Tax=Ditylenchus destructor TaxID=166010 RepID=A0AAD4MJ13_9BILA|nr:protein lifeguard 1 [Ditylenchus destructor]